MGSKGCENLWFQRVAKNYGFKGLQKIMVSRGCKKIWLIRVVKKILRMVAKKKNSEKKRKYANIFTITGIFFAKGKRKDQKDQFLAYNMSLFLKEENGRLALRYIIYFAKVLLLKRKNCESCYATKLDVKVAKAAKISVKVLNLRKIV